MLVTHWMKAVVIAVYLVAMLWVLNRYTSLFQHPQPQSAQLPAADIDPRARARAAKQKAFEEEMARRHAAYRALEADLAAMLKTDLPLAIHELAVAAARFRLKRSDLARLKAADQWARELPVKEALVRTKELTAEWHQIDLEAQQGREGPSPYVAEMIERHAQNLKAFKKSEIEIDAFAASLPPLYGKVPEGLIVAALDALATGVLPADAFDPCRTPGACPAVPPAASLPAPPAAKAASTYCARVMPPALLRVYAEPSPASTVVAHLKPDQCGIIATGRVEVPLSGPWQEIKFTRRSGWVRVGVIYDEALFKPGLRPVPAKMASAPVYCVDAARIGSLTGLPLRARPSPHALPLASVAPGSCRLIGTGNIVPHRQPAGVFDYYEVTDADGRTGWVNAHFVTRKF